MSSRADPPKVSQHEPERRPPAGRLDKAFPVFLEGERGVAAGIGRNISDSGMFVETREPFPLGSRVRVTFTSPSGGAEMVLEGEVRYQCFINFTRADAVRAGMRGIGLKFVAPKSAQARSPGTLH
jgi:PilZ domain